MAKSLAKVAPAHRAETDPTHIKDLVPDPANRRAHNPRNIGMVVDALQHVGAARSIVIDEDNVILAGNGVTEAAAEAGITRVRVVEASGDEIIAVRRSGLTAEQKRALAIYDNRTGELATWDFEQLAADEAAGLSLQPFWTEEESAALLAKHRGLAGGLTDPDEVPAERATDIVLGDLFALGRHRLLCGDCTVAGHVSRLMGSDRPALLAADPPYGMDYHALSGPAQDGMALSQRRHVAPIIGDAQPFNPMPAVSLVDCEDVFLWGGDWFYQYLPAGGSWVIWDKRASEAADSIPGAPFEVCWVKNRRKRDIIRVPWGGWNNKERGDSVRWHPTQKPVECIRKLFEFSAALIVYDPFGGSGTSLIAAEQIGRSCLSMEIDPHYCQATIDRWEAFTGQKAEKVAEAVPA